jgi:hypothetical protein
MSKDSQALTAREPQELAVATPAISSLTILEAAVRGGINKDNVEVVERLVALRRDELREESKAAFAIAFFQLRKTMPEIYADKQAKDKGGNVVYTYCSEEEISRMLEPHLFTHGFTMLFGQRAEDSRTVAIVTLIHERGHQETREYSVRSGATNAMKDATAADAGSTTTAWRHLIIKMFGLKSRIRSDLDARLEGSPITQEQADELEHRIKMTNSKVDVFLRLAGVDAFAKIPVAKYDVLTQLLEQKERQGK